MPQDFSYDKSTLVQVTAFAKLYSPTSANNSILAGVQYIYLLYIKFCLNIGH